MIYDHLNCHTAAPDTGQAFGGVGSIVKSTVATLTVCSQILGDTEPRRRCAWTKMGSLQDIKLAGLVELDWFETRIFHRQTLTLY